MCTSNRFQRRWQIILLACILGFLFIIILYTFMQHQRVQRLHDDQIARLQVSGMLKLRLLQNQVASLQIYQIDAGPYLQIFNADQRLLKSAKDIPDFLRPLRNIDRDSKLLQMVLAQANDAHEQVKLLQQEATDWAKAHPYYDSFDHHTYILDSGYVQEGIGGILSRKINQPATTLSKLQSIAAEAQHALFLLHMLEADFQDKTAYNHIHATDMQILTHDHLNTGQVVVISLVEQALRVYQNGKLVQSFLVTTGRPELPSLPGDWNVLDRRSNITFTAAEPKSSPYWFPDTPIHYATLYHAGGYFIHDATWRDNFGPGTQFPHWDKSGNTNFNTYGSHGCINLQDENARWLYMHTDWLTSIVIY